MLKCLETLDLVQFKEITFEFLRESINKRKEILGIRFA
jgi:hypothetical protein